MSIEFREGAVCFAGGEQWSLNDGVSDVLFNNLGTYRSFDELLIASYFQLNEMRQGDYIEASELDTEQGYNDAVEVFGLFGFRWGDGALSRYSSSSVNDALTCCDDGLWQTAKEYGKNKRKLTYPQLMAIGELKRLEVERSSPKIARQFSDEYYETHNIDGTLKDSIAKPSFSKEPLSSCEGEWTDKHYNNFYQLTEEDIKIGQIKIDAYFVNRMWKINQWDDTGAGFHILKTLPRIANNKNSLKRELVALKKQVDILCKLHGVDDEDLK